MELPVSNGLIKFKLFLLLIVFSLIVNGEEQETTDTKPAAPLFHLNNEKRLIDDLFKNYQVKFGRPVNNMAEKVIVNFEVFLIQLIDLDEREQVLITNVETQYIWNDNGLKWNKEDYGGVENIRLPVIKIWTPDIVLYNYADTRLEEKREVLAIVNFDGKVKWRPSSIFKSTCQINIQSFPYDHQNCLMKFGSWTYDGESIDIQFLDKPEINRDLYIPSNEWEVLSGHGKRNEKKYECCKEIYPDITYEIKMKRKGGFYNYILVLPCVLLSALTTVLFWLPPESPAKMLLGMNIFTSFFVLLLLLSKNVPSATDKIPLIGAYYCLNMLMIATSTCACTIVVHVFFRGQGKVPYILRKVFLEFLGRLLCMVLPTVLPTPPFPLPGKQHIDKTRKLSANKSNAANNYKQTTLITSINNTSQLNGNLLHHLNRNSLPRNLKDQFNSVSCTSIDLNEEINRQLETAQMIQPELYLNTNQLNSPSRMLHDKNPVYLQQAAQQQLVTQTSQPQAHAHTHLQSNQLNNELNLSFNLIENDIKEIRDYLRHTRKKLESTDLKTKQTNEWKQVALILDRTLFFIYIIAMFISITLVLHA